MENAPQTNPTKTASVILGVCLVLSTIIGSYTFYQVRSSDNGSLEVTGSTRQKVTSDTVKWTSQFTRQYPEYDLKTGYAQMAKDAAVVTKFFKDHGIADDSLNLTPVFLEQDYRNQNVNDPKYYNLRQTVEVRSSDVEKITALAKNIQTLVDAGLIFSTQSPEYSYSKLPELRVQLLGEAVKDAKTRAENIAESGDKRVGSMKSASVGVVQVLAVNSTDVSDYGAYDTSSIDKEVMVTVRVTFHAEVMRARFVAGLLFLGWFIAVPVFAHGGVSQHIGNVMVYLNQTPISPLVGEDVKMAFSLRDLDNNPLRNVPVQLTLTETFFGDASKDTVLFEQSMVTDVNGDLEYHRRYDHMAYYDLDLSFKDPKTNKEEETGFLIQPREIPKTTSGVPVMWFGIMGLAVGYALKSLLVQHITQK